MGVTAAVMMRKFALMLALRAAVVPVAIAARGRELQSEAETENPVYSVHNVNWSNSPPKNLSVVCGDVIRFYWDSDKEISLYAGPSDSCHGSQKLVAGSKRGYYAYRTGPQTAIAFRTYECVSNHTTLVMVNCDTHAHLLPWNVTIAISDGAETEHNVDWSKPQEVLDVKCGDTVKFAWSNTELDLWELHDGKCPSKFEDSANATQLLSRSGSGEYTFQTGPQVGVDFASSSNCKDGHLLHLNVDCSDHRHLVDKLPAAQSGPVLFKVNWDNPPERFAVDCGDIVEFTWTQSHNLWEIPMGDCPEFTEGPSSNQIQLAERSEGGNYTYTTGRQVYVQFADSRDCQDGHKMELDVICKSHAHLLPAEGSGDNSANPDEDKDESPNVIAIVAGVCAAVAVVALVGLYVYRKKKRASYGDVKVDGAPEGDMDALVQDDDAH